jgi:glyoxylase-like metal-dependent hydrolase (beta-lactamase superfamily II)
VRRGREIPFCAENIAREYGPNRTIDVVLPTITFDDALTLHLGGITCELHHLPTDHTDDSILIYVPEEKVLFLGDAIGGNLYASPPYFSVDGVTQLMATLARFPAQWFIESHCEPEDSEGFWAANRIVAVVAELMREGLAEREALIETVRQRLAGALPEDYEETIDLFFAATPKWAQPTT